MVVTSSLSDWPRPLGAAFFMNKNHIFTKGAAQRWNVTAL
jgi:hypothetical protein